MRPFRKSTRAQLMLCAAVGALAIGVGSARAEDNDHQFDIAPQSLTSALYEFGAKSTRQVMFTPDVTASKMTGGVHGAADEISALEQLLTGTGLSYRTEGDVLVIVQAGEPGRPQSGSAAGDGADQGTVQALIVTAQKREEQIQDVPIAISAFTEKSLQEQKIEGGFDLLKAIPNVTFSKNNFTSYNFSIRGIGTKAISATTDPGVAVSFNNTTVIQNRLFEQEYFDIERVEVLRGPQGTLYGRNATAGVINLISAKPNLQEFDGWLKGEVGNYHAKRVSAMVNIPLVEDELAIRLAGALTDREGYDFNTGTGHAVNGRDLWSTRMTIGFEPTDRLRANLVWERFREDDNRSRTGKQLCHRSDVDKVGNTVLDDPTLGVGVSGNLDLLRAIFSQGCEPGSLYSDSAFETPNGLSINFINPILLLRASGVQNTSTAIGKDPTCGNALTCQQAIFKARDPYGGRLQSRDLREIESIRDPVYRAGADLLQLSVDFDVTDALRFSSQTLYDKDDTYSFQDFNRFNTDPIFTDTSQLNPVFGNDYSQLAPGGVFCDPQIGCSDKLAGFDIAQASAEQFNQEFRLQSSFDGPVNFSVGANYTRFKAVIDYFVFFNALTALAETLPLNDPGGPYGLGGGSSVFGSPDGPPTMCATSNFWNNFPAMPFPTPPGYPIPPTNSPPVATSDPNSPCPFVDPNPIDTSRNFGTGGNNEGEGHNYFRSKNPYKLKSWAMFGETYWNIRDDLKLTVGLRYTDDTKTFDVVPSQVLTAPSYIAGGTTPIGYPMTGVIKQHWGEWTGRLVVDWKPELDFTDQTLLYGSFSRGYKGGGANPPTPGFATKEQIEQILLDQGYGQGHIDYYSDQLGTYPVLELTANEYGKTFDPEFINAYEVGAKNTLLGGGMTLNATAFYYDYKDYQVSQIRDRTAVNENFDARMWGLELETMFAPSRNLQIIGNFGYLGTRIADGETSIDIMNRTQSNPNYTLVKPWVQLPSNCVVPTPVAEAWLHHSSNAASFIMCGMGGVLGQFGAPLDPNPDIGGGLLPYDVDNYPELNGGAGLLADLGGNELPNAPHWTANIGAQYGHDILDGSWRATVRADAYWQSQSWARVYNDDPYDKLHGWYNVNLSVWFERPDDDLKIELYAKNLLDKTPITDAFLNSDDTALTTNVFVLDPRLIGLSIRKGF